MMLYFKVALITTFLFAFLREIWFMENPPHVVYSMLIGLIWPFVLAAIAAVLLAHLVRLTAEAIADL
ncbi:MAG: hypothetical protein SVC26_06465 [Pseudomonadota bacterium]|nr:hypothetical protein [Pseudomonadota bacterium]